MEEYESSYSLFNLQRDPFDSNMEDIFATNDKRLRIRSQLINVWLYHLWDNVIRKESGSERPFSIIALFLTQPCYEQRG